MRSADVSPDQGHGPLARRSVNATLAPYFHGSRPPLTSQFRGPFLFNETDEERKAREDKEKQTNFDKVREKAEREEAEKKAAIARAEEAERKLKEREDADKAAAQKKLEEEKQFEQIAKDKEAEANAKAAEAAAEKARADAAEAKVKAFEDQQEAELAELLKTIPKEKQPPLDPTDPVGKRLTQAKYAASLLKTGPKPPVGGGGRHDTEENASRKEELLKKGWNKLSAEEATELADLMESTE